MSGPPPAGVHHSGSDGAGSGGAGSDGSGPDPGAGRAGPGVYGEELKRFAAEVGDVGPVVVVGHRTRWNPEHLIDPEHVVDPEHLMESPTAGASTDQAAASGGASGGGGVAEEVRFVSAPVGVRAVDFAEMTIRCGAGTSVADVQAALAAGGQTVPFPPGGTIGGALAVGRSDHRRLRTGALRDSLLQAVYVDAAGQLVTAGGPTVKNVSGFDLCRLLVGSWGTLGFLGEVILRTRPLPQVSRWFTAAQDPWALLAGLYRPSSILYDGATTWVLLEGHDADVEEQADRFGLTPADAPELPSQARTAHRPGALRDVCAGLRPQSFVAEVGVGVVHHREPLEGGGVLDRAPVPDAVRRLHVRIKQQFDPSGRLNPGLDVLDVT